MCAASRMGTNCSLCLPRTGKCLGLNCSEGHLSPGKTLKGEKERVEGSSCPGRLEFWPRGIFSTGLGNKLYFDPALGDELGDHLNSLMAPFAVLYLFICVYVAFEGSFGWLVSICFCARAYEQGAGSSQCDRTYIRVLISNDMQIREL